MVAIMMMILMMNRQQSIDAKMWFILQTIDHRHIILKCPTLDNSFTLISETRDCHHCRIFHQQ